MHILFAVIALAAGVIGLPQNETMPVLKGSQLADCSDFWFAAGMEEGLSDMTCVTAPKKESLSYQQRYQQALEAAGWQQQTGAANAVTYCKSGNALTIAGFPARRPGQTSVALHQDQIVFLFAVDPEGAC